MSVTSSVSTVIFLEELSPEVCPLPLNLSPELDCLLCRRGGGAAILDRLVLVLTLPLSLPLSLVVAFKPDLILIDVASEFLFRVEPCEVAVSSSFLMAASKPGRGVFGWLTSCTVSRVDEPLLGPRPGVLIPDDRYDSSTSISVVDCELGSTCGEGVARCTLITGGSGSLLRADEAAVGLPKVGGGDFSRGEIGHRGASLEVSRLVDDFCGTGVRRIVSVADGGGKLGIEVAESCRGIVAVGMLDLIRGGLGSWALLLRDWTGDVDVDTRFVLAVVLVTLVGDGSLDSAGEAVKDVEADVHLEGCVSRFALDGTEVSLSMEFKLEMLASRPAG